MLRQLTDRLREALNAVRSVFTNRELRRLELAYVLSNVGGWTYWVTVAVFAYAAGGVTAVGVLGFARLVASALVSPFAGALADRFARRAVMVGADLTRAGALVVAAVTVRADGPELLVYALTIGVALATTVFSPAQAALLPSLARDPEELTAANVVSSTVESLGVFIGPALGGVLLATGGTDLAFAAAGLAFLGSAGFLMRLSEPDRSPSESPEDAEESDEGHLAGVRVVASSSPLRLLTAVFAAQTLVDGVLAVLVVVLAIDELAAGEAAVGYLNAAAGVGGLVGAAIALLFVGRSLSGLIIAGMVLWGVSLVILGIIPGTLVAILLLVVLGIGNTLIDVGGYTLMQRAVPNELLGRAFGVLESAILASIAVGSLLAPVLVEAFGLRVGLIAAGALLPLLALLFGRSLRRLDLEAPVPPGLALLSGVPVFETLSRETLEALAGQLQERRFEPGDELLRQGDHGVGIYVLDEGEADVVIDGIHTSIVRKGDLVGEIALLREMPRTASVVARTPVIAHALSRASFLAAVTGHADSAEAAEALVASRLGALRPGLGSL